ncbi:dienelactone hydrolase family protein [Paraferrimonas sp. SM1919]|uniref:dienelactone hydrolase family protein n=1 Tax=Paraferrimonas sp. SM1919 TaxID=2662263 RepID=UPI0013D6B7B7|nr:dienelactone hydrolase family protein [Paraferrimonas sp. SM1919]
MQIKQHIVDIETPTGSMRNYIYRPKSEGAFAPIIFYSEIFQHTDPISRAAAILAGHGFCVIVPEVFHEFNPIGTVLGYDDIGKNKGNNDKHSKPLTQYDSDNEALIQWLSLQDYTTDKVGVIGVCIGGHLAFRAALQPQVKAAFCLYATDIHSGTLPAPSEQQSLARSHEISAELVMVWGKQDPHVDASGREQIYRHLRDAGVNHVWLEVNAEHAFMRDNDARYDPALALQMYSEAVALFNRTLK